VGLHPSKGGKGGWVFLDAPFVLPEYAALDMQHHEQDREGSADESRVQIYRARRVRGKQAKEVIEICSILLRNPARYTSDRKPHDILHRGDSSREREVLIVRVGL